MNRTVIHRVILGLLLAGLAAGWGMIAGRARGTLVVYCTHDLVYAEPVLEEFTRRTGIAVTLVGDTEATKSLGLTERLLKEEQRTPCDLFWNNEVLGMIRLQHKGMLATYQGTAADRIPSQFCDPDHQWFGFAGRMRVWIMRSDATVEPKQLSIDLPSGTLETSIISGLASQHSLVVSPEFPPPRSVDPSRLAIAKPLYGTTFTQFALMWKAHGAQKTQQYHQSLTDSGCRFLAGNAMVRDTVAAGGCDLGMTDTDDVFSAIDAGHRVTMAPIRLNGKTICIPNTVGIIRGCDRPEEARQLLEFLLSEEVELLLAKTARQIPLGRTRADQIPAEVQPLAAWATESWNVADAAPVADDCLQWLKSEYTK